MLFALTLRLRLRVLLSLVTAAVVCLAATPGVRRFACRIGAMDKPDTVRHIHDHPIPRLGGLGIFAGFLAGVLMFMPLTPPIQGILLGSILIVVTGAVDDLVDLKPRVKLLCQTVAAVIAIAFGIRINILAGITGDIELGLWAYPVTFLWIVGVTNAMNLIDGIDGLAVGVSGISCASTLLVSLFVPEATDASVLLGALGGACLGFLPFNRNPAKIFMGDTGSMLLGFVLSTAAVYGLFKSYAIITCAVPLLTLALPIADTLFAIVRRISKGQSPLKADRGHIHHRLMALGLSQRQVVWLLYGISAILGLAAVLLADQGVNRLWFLLAAVIIAVILWLYLFPKKKNDPPEEDHKNK